MCRCVSLWCNNKIMLWWCKSKKFGTVGKYPLELQGVNTPCKQMNPNLSSIKLSPGGLWQFTLSPIRRYDATHELGHTYLGRTTTACFLLLYIHNHNIYCNTLSNSLHTSFLRVIMHHEPLQAGYSRLTSG